MNIRGSRGGLRDGTPLPISKEHARRRGACFRRSPKLPTICKEKDHTRAWSFSLQIVGSLGDRRKQAPRRLACSLLIGSGVPSRSPPREPLMFIYVVRRIVLAIPIA